MLNIFNFLTKREETNVKFLENLLITANRLCFDKNFVANILSEIELHAKIKILHIIKYEGDIAQRAGLSENLEDFIENLSNSLEWKKYFFEEYPNIENYLKKEYYKVRELVKTVIICLNQDASILGISKNKINEIKIGKGDWHCGLSTCEITLDDRTIFFKPRSLKIDILIMDFFHSIEERMKKEIFYPVVNIDRGHYGWSYEVDKLECKNSHEVADFYFNMGFLLALSYFLNLEDLIYDNVIASGKKIALIDLECSFSNPTNINELSQFVLNSNAGKIILNSVINSGIVPRHTFANRNNDGESDSSLSYYPERTYNGSDIDISNDSYKINKKQKKYRPVEHHIPFLNGNPIPVKNFYSDVLNGFEFGFNYLSSQKNLLYKFLDKIKEARVEKRIIFRPTKIYSILLNELFSMNSFTDKDYREKIINSLDKGIYIGLNSKIIESEKNQIQKYNIPAFKQVIGEPILYDFKGDKVCKLNDKQYDISRLYRKIENINKDDFSTQEKIIVNSLKVFENIEPDKNQTIFRKKSRKASYDDFLKTSINYLKSQLYVSKRGVSCVNIFNNTNGAWDYGVVGPGLSNGLGGIALLFSLYGYFFNDIETKEIGGKILKEYYNNFRAQVNEIELFESVGHILLSPFQYPTNLIYINEVIKNVTKEEILPSTELEINYQKFIDRYIEFDEHLDLLTGSTGGIFLFYQLYKNCKSSKGIDIIEKFSNQVLKGATITENYAFWETEKYKRLGGFSHGTSSFSVAMLLASDILNKQQYLNIFEKALRYDNSLYNKDLGGYIDLRYKKKVTSSAWAHGFGGIGLSKLLIDNYLPNKILDDEFNISRMALEQTISNTIKSGEGLYSINGGFAGNIEILQALNSRLGINNEYIDNRFLNFLNNIYDGKNNLIGQKNHIHLFFNQGITGLAYSVLRRIFRTEVPSVLTLGTNTNFGTKHLYCND